jgi:hypothetical protein
VGISTGSVITRNWFDAIGNFDFGYAVTIRNNFYADVTDNKMTRVWTGIHTTGHNGAGGPASWTFSGNEIHSYASGLCHWLHYNGATNLTFDNNDIFAETGAVANNFGMLIVSIQNAVNPSYTNNTVTGTDYGIGLFNVSTSSFITLGSTNTITGTNIAGVFLTNNLNFNPVGTTNFLAGGPGAASTVNISGIGITSAAGGTGIRLDASSIPTTVQTMNFNAATTLNGGTTGLSVNGSTTAITGNTINNLSFAGQTGNYITLSNSALDNLTLTATGSSFDGTTGAGKTLVQNFATEDKITHALDNSSLGFVLVKAVNDFVTTNSGSIQRGVDAASNGFTVNVNTGSYNENVLVNKEVNVSGQGQLSTYVYPSVSDPNCGGGGGGSLCAGASNIFLVQANNVTIHDMTIDGDNTSLAGGINVNGANVDARNGIITNHNAGVYSNLEVYNTTIKNIFLRGIYASSGGSFNFHDNAVDNVYGLSGSIGMFNFGGAGSYTNNTVTNCNDAIASNWSTGSTYTGNTVTNCLSGIHTDNNGGSGGIADIISGNTVQNSPASGYGIWVFAPYRAVQVTGNTVTNVEVGMACAGQQAAVTPVFSGNEIDGQNKVNSTGVYITTSLFGSSIITT